MKYGWDPYMTKDFAAGLCNLFRSVFICLNNNKTIDGPLGNIEIERDHRFKEFYTITVRYLDHIVLQFWVGDNILHLVKFWNGHWANYLLRLTKEN